MYFLYIYMKLFGDENFELVRTAMEPNQSLAQLQQNNFPCVKRSRYVVNQPSLSRDKIKERVEL
jgi:hypothetical protein